MKYLALFLIILSSCSKSLREENEKLREENLKEYSDLMDEIHDLRKQNLFYKEVVEEYSMLHKEINIRNNKNSISLGQSYSARIHFSILDTSSKTHVNIYRIEKDSNILVGQYELDPLKDEFLFKPDKKGSYLVDAYHDVSDTLGYKHLIDSDTIFVK